MEGLKGLVVVVGGRAFRGASHGTGLRRQPFRADGLLTLLNDAEFHIHGPKDSTPLYIMAIKGLTAYLSLYNIRAWGFRGIAGCYG